MAEKVARTAAIHEVAEDVLVIDAVPVEPPELRWRAGQFLSLRTGDRRSGDANARRSYSIASSPDAGVELLVKLVPDGVGSDFFRTLKQGDEIHFTGPMGFFVCDLQHAGDAVFCATGTGIAAALPMIRETLARPNERGRVVLYWGMRNQSELYWVDRLDALAAGSPRFYYDICLSRPEPGWTGTASRINARVLDGTFDRPVYYLVGNGNMVRDLRAALQARGVDRKKQIRTEIFYPATDA
jgi:CDP-4-dehydro-6-deoxyglucose reductase